MGKDHPWPSLTFQDLPWSSMTFHDLYDLSIPRLDPIDSKFSYDLVLHGRQIYRSFWSCYIDMLKWCYLCNEGFSSKRTNFNGIVQYIFFWGLIWYIYKLHNITPYITKVVAQTVWPSLNGDVGGGRFLILLLLSKSQAYCFLCWGSMNIINIFLIIYYVTHYFSESVT